MRALFTFCAICCFMAFLRLPIGYYTFLRIIVSIGAVVAIYNLISYKNYYGALAFTMVFILFNPLFPIYLYRKSIWLTFDILTGLLFLWLTFLKKNTPLKKESELSYPIKTYTRDRIISSKSLTKKQN